MVLRRALWVLPVGAFGGVARHALDAARAGIPGWALTVAVPEGPTAAALRTAGADVVTARIGRDHGLRASVAAYRSVVREVRPDLVHTHLAYADAVAALATPRGVPLVSTEHGIAEDDLVYHGSAARSAARARAHRLRLRRSDALIAVSEATLAAARRKWLPPDRLPQFVVPNGVDQTWTATRPDPGLHVVSLARLAPEKRIRDLLVAFATVARWYAGARLTVAGEGPLEDDLKRQAAALGIARRVSFPGFVDADRLLARADVVAQLSIWENCSYTLLDAAARGLGVVAAPVGGNPEQLPARCLVDPADHRGVADALVWQGTDLAQRPALPPGWPTVADMADRLGEVYASVLAGTATRRAPCLATGRGR